MKWALFCAMMTAGLLSYAQDGLLDQRVSCRLEQHTLAEALTMLSTENDINLSFSNSYLPADRRLTFDFQDIKLATVLNLILQHTDLSYTVAQDYLIIRPLEPEEPPVAPLTFTVSGLVEDSLSGERLIGANIYFPELQRGTSTNANGFFSITLPAGQVRMDVSYVGYHAATFSLDLFENTRLQVNLPQAGVLAVVEVRAPAPGGGKAEVLPREPGRERLPTPVIERMPGFLGENDVLTSLSWLPGVQAGTGSFGNLSVRNGDNGHNLILLDGAQIYNANHMFGLYSVFNGSAVKDVELIKGAMPARYGGRLSSIVAVNGREGDFNQFRGEASLGMIVTKALVEGPIKPGKMSFLVSGRRSFWDWLARPVIKSIDPEAKLGYHFGDLNIKVKHKVSEKDDWNFTLYLGQDYFRYLFREDSLYDSQVPGFPDGVNYDRKDDVLVLWNNKAASLQWNRVWNDRLFSVSSVAFSESRFKLRTDFEERGREPTPAFYRAAKAFYGSGVRDVSLRSDFDLNLAPRLRLTFGGAFIWHHYLPQASGDVFQTLSEDDGSFGDPELGGRDIRFDPLQLDALETGAYAELRGRFHRLRWQLGAHLASFYHTRLFVSVQPRLQLNYEMKGKQEVIAAFRLNEQYAHLLSNNAISLPTDLWVPSTGEVRPQRSWQASLGWQKFWGEDITLRLEGYYHQMDRLTTFSAGQAFFDGSNWEDKMVQGKGNSYGWEASLRKMDGRLQGILSYDLSWSWREFPGLNNNEPFPFRFNRRHQVSVMGLYRISPRVRFSLGWTYGSGNFITISSRYAPVAYPRAHEDGNLWVTDITSSGEINNYRTPDYHRLDINFDFLRQRKKYLRKWSLGIYNAYNQRNPTIIYPEENYPGPRELYAVSVFMLIPSVSYQLKF